jgi:Asp-tRNA(Asn)/Glu-tRNA(Gln) amidotransferase A subunit family amidase
LNLVGLACRLNKIYSENGTCVKILENAGAIVIVRGNIPQLAMAYDSDNFIFGKAKNPWN